MTGNDQAAYGGRTTPDGFASSAVRGIAGKSIGKGLRDHPADMCPFLVDREQGSGMKQGQSNASRATNHYGSDYREASTPTGFGVRSLLFENYTEEGPRSHRIMFPVRGEELPLWGSVGLRIEALRCS